MVILVFFSIFISYYLISFCLIKVKSRKICNKKNFIFKNLKFKVIDKYIFNLNKLLYNLEFPLGLNLRNYIFIKYFLSDILFFILYFNKVNILRSIVLFLFIFFLPNILIYIYKINEKKKVIEEVSNIAQDLYLSLACNVTLYDALSNSLNVLSYNRLKKELNIFIQDWKFYNFNLKKVSEDIKEKFNIGEFGLFINIIDEIQSKGNDEKLLIGFFEYIQEQKLKYNFIKNSSNTFLLISVTFFLIMNSFFIVIYPISIQIINNLNSMLD